MEIRNRVTGPHASHPSASELFVVDGLSSEECPGETHKHEQQQQTRAPTGTQIPLSGRTRSTWPRRAAVQKRNPILARHHHHPRPEKAISNVEHCPGKDLIGILKDCT